MTGLELCVSSSWATLVRHERPSEQMKANHLLPLIRVSGVSRMEAYLRRKLPRGCECYALHPRRQHQPDGAPRCVRGLILSRGLLP